MELWSMDVHWIFMMDRSMVFAHWTFSGTLAHRTFPIALCLMLWLTNCLPGLLSHMIIMFSFIRMIVFTFLIALQGWTFPLTSLLYFCTWHFDACILSFVGVIGFESLWFYFTWHSLIWHFILHASVGSRLQTCALLPGHFFLFFSCAGRSGRTGEPGEDIVDVTVGRLTHSSASQYLALCGGITVLSSLVSPVGLWAGQTVSS